jgi:hypothetical protein
MADNRRCAKWIVSRKARTGSRRSTAMEDRQGTLLQMVALKTPAVQNTVHA